MASFRDWLVFSRTHTAALTIPGVLVSAYLADPTQGWPRFTLFGVFALCAHASGFAINNLFDLSWDRSDPSKINHPLVAGRIRERDAWFATIIMMSMTFYLGAMLSRTWTGTFFLLSFVLFGTLYNYASKRTTAGPIYISISFASLPLYAWFASGGHADATLLYIAVYSFFLMVAQISISGYAKELAVEGEVNMLRDLGAYATHQEAAGTYYYFFPAGVKLRSCILRAIMAGLAVGFTATLGGPRLLTFTLAFLAYVTLQLVVASGYWIRKRKVLLMGVSEILAYWALVVSLSPLLGTTWTIALVFGPLLYYILANKIFWNTWAAPAV